MRVQDLGHLICHVSGYPADVGGKVPERLLADKEETLCPGFVQVILSSI